MGDTPAGGFPWPRLLLVDATTRLEQIAPMLVWPTPNTMDGMSLRDPETVVAWNNAKDGRSNRTVLGNLRQAVVDKGYLEKFPTPRVEDGESSGAHRGVPDTLTSYTRQHASSASFCTPTVEDASRKGDAEMADRWAVGDHVPDTHKRLRTQAMAFPTPTSSMMSMGDMEQARFAGNSDKRPSYQVANTTIWPTPMAGTNRTSQKAQSQRPTSGPSRGGSSFGLEDAALLAEQEVWPTPIASDRSQRNSGDDWTSLSVAVKDREWPTPTAQTNRKSARAMTASKNNGRRSGGGQSSPPALEQMVELATGIIPKELSEVAVENLPAATQRLWPTPVVSDASGGPGCHGRQEGDNLRTSVHFKQWPTPKANEWKGPDFGRHTNASGKRHAGDNLATVVAQTWPTPLAGNPDPGSGGNHGGMALLDAARQATFGSPTSSNKVRSGDFSDGRTPTPAELAFSETGQPGQLNPDWVELLMGWPIGWTKIDPIPADEFERWIDGFAVERIRADAFDLNATYGPVAWRTGVWEYGIPRIATQIVSRVSRLKAIGNGQVPACAAWAAVVLFETMRQFREVLHQAAEGSAAIDFFDLVDR